MTSVTIAELLARASDFEARLERCYAEIRDATRDNGVKLLTYYLSRHRRHLAQALEGLDALKIGRINRVRLKFDVDLDSSLASSLLGHPAETITSAELLAAAVDVDSTLIDLYTGILAQPVGPDAAPLFESLVKIEERDVVMLRKMIAMNYF